MTQTYIIIDICLGSKKAKEYN